MRDIKLRAVRRTALGCVALAGMAVAASSAVGATANDFADRCRSLLGLKPASGTVEKAELFVAGAPLLREPATGVLSALNSLKAPAAFCKVRTRLRPTRDSDILVETWLPETWNGKLLGMGGGGFSGGLATAALTLRKPLAVGYAGVATDVGHAASDSAKWAFGHREKLIDYAYRGNHLAAVTGKQLVQKLYGKPVKRSYFHGCSNGGRDALMEVSRFPGDYDGVIAGAPAANWTALMTSFVANRQTVFGPAGAPALSARLKLINDAVIRKCDGLDNVLDGVLEDPRKCRFDPAELQCGPDAGADSCLSPSEVLAARKLYQGTRLSSGQLIMNGFAPGGETTSWDEWITAEKSSQSGFGNEFFRWMVYGKADWDASKFDLDPDYFAAKSQVGFLNSNGPDIRPFIRRGGKLILYHGWNDAAIPPLDTVAYYEAARRISNPSGSSIRLFMAPGMGHCFGGPGPNSFDMLPQIDRWVESGTAPEVVVATKYPNDLLALLQVPMKAVRTRPLCAWPKVARYKGTGATDEADNFVCAQAD